MSHLTEVPQRSIISRVLIVDDAAEVSEFRANLKARGYEVHVARDAGQARSLTVTRRPDFVFTEGLLPEETGFELCSFLKRQNEALPVVMLTEIDLDAGRNLAIWCGADGYVTKPYDFEFLERMIGAVADAVWLRTHVARQSLGSIEFACDCGKRLSVRTENAGKGVQCPKCQKIIITPKFSTLQSGVWKRSSTAADPQDENRRADLFCSRCGHLVVLPSHNSRNDHAVCATCGHKQNVPRWLLDNRRFYFQPPAADILRDHLIRRRLQRFLTVNCAACQGKYTFDPQRPESACRCPHCQHVDEHPSLRKSPLARAALAATGRLFNVSAGRNKARKFLLPENRELLVGSDECCSLRFTERDISPFHCALWWDDNRVWVRPLTEDSPTFVNKEVILAELALEPGDTVRLGNVRLTLMGSRHLDLTQDDMTTDVSGEESVRMRDARIARQAATVLQLHWEFQRDWLLEHPEWDVIDEIEPPPEAEAPVLAPRKQWSLKDQNSHVLLSDGTVATGETEITSGTSARMPQIPEAPPPLKLPDPTTCGPVETPQAPPAAPLTIRERRQLEQQNVNPSDQAAQIISGLFQRPQRRS